MTWMSRRPSPAMVVALLALVMATTGTAVAAKSLLVNGDKLIRKDTLSGNRLRGHTLTGRQINLSRLGKVPSAAHADSATHATSAATASTAANATNAVMAVNATNAANAVSATNATTAANATHATSATTANAVNGNTITHFFQTVATNATTPVVVLASGGLTLDLACNSGGEPTVRATAAASGSLMMGTALPQSTAATTIGTSSATAGSPHNIWTPANLFGTFDLHYQQTDGSFVDVDAVVDDTHTINNFDGCLLEGTAISG
jgi:hypothetical protein